MPIQKQEASETKTSQVARLFIGGPKDGQKVCIDAHAHKVMIGESGPIQSSIFQSPTKKMFSYRGEQMMGGGLTEPLIVFIIDGMTTGQALTRLVNFYRPS